MRVNGKEVEFKKAKGHAHLFITLDKGRIVVQHDDGSVLKEFLATDSSWDLIWNGINDAFDQSNQVIQHAIMNALKEGQDEKK